MKAVELEKAYNPKTFEGRIYSLWKEQGAFKPASVKDGDEPFVIVIPPPNVTGVLHLGHGLNNSLQDIIIRYHRMRGEPTLWVPGTDHAGIATQNVVERKLKKQGINRHDLGREKFIEETWKVKHEHHAIISEQLSRIGASVDWDRERFTLDEGLARAVREVFVTLYERDLLYKGNYLVNWCSSCGTALSDDEVEHEDIPGKMYHLWYYLEEGKSEKRKVKSEESGDNDGGNYVEIATTRPETLLGDTAVAVHPEDERYADLKGKTVILPLAGREIPVVFDTYVDRAFGTGVVKITPAHDPNDWEVAKRHNLPVINILNADGTLNGEVPEKYRGMTVKQARAAVLEDLKAGGWYVKEENHNHAVGHCYRCRTVIEPYLSEQWFVRMKPLAEKALDCWRRGEIIFYPQKWQHTYRHWMENIRDWCISRQLWWGHRIPAWDCKDCGKTSVSRNDLSACPRCGSANIEQDPDVLDTWFSSWLWPFSTLGWGEGIGDQGSGEENYGNTNIQGFDSLAGSNEPGRNDLSANEELSKRGNVRTNQSDQESGRFSSGQYSGGPWTERPKGVSTLSVDCERLGSGTGNPPADSGTAQVYDERSSRSVADPTAISASSAGCHEKISFTEAGTGKIGDRDQETGIGDQGSGVRGCCSDYDIAFELHSDSSKTDPRYPTPDTRSPSSDFTRFYPTTALVTAYDIIFFWVARMIMAGLEFTGKAPFRDIYIHGLVRDKQGRKMSKSLGNGLDPLELVDEFGADALKFTLAFMCAQGQDLLVDKESFKMGSKFANKVWNASRYILMNLEGRNLVENPGLLPVDKWIYSRLNSAAKAMEEAFLSYRFNDAAQTAYEYFWNDFCDWYVEATKLSMKTGEDASLNAAEKDRAATTLLDALAQSLRLLHPLLPFVTEEIYGKLPNTQGLLITAPYPQFDESRRYPQEEKQFAFLQEFVRMIRTLRSECTITPDKKLPVTARLSGEQEQTLRQNEGLVKLLAGIGELEIGNRDQGSGIRDQGLGGKSPPSLQPSSGKPDGGLPLPPSAGDTPATPPSSTPQNPDPRYPSAPRYPIPDTRPPAGSIGMAGANFEVFVFIAEAVDISALKRKFGKELERDRAYIQGLRAKLANEQFVKNAPPELVAAEKIKLDEGLARTEKIESYLREL